ncbi:MAG: deoxyribodipyrimidine photo-lyase [Methanoregula sp.]|nr:deoxyribodipyrimidine photo-lyase [Methanoregula sp.]
MAESRVDPGRIRIVSNAPLRTKDYILYWMQSSHRAEENPALAYAIEQADAAHLPVVAYFGFFPGYPEANLRHLVFLLEGIGSAARALEALGIRFVFKAEDPAAGVLSLARDAALLVSDRGYLRPERSWYEKVAARSPCRFVQVEANAVVPVRTVSETEEYSAGTIRKKIMRQLDRFLVHVPVRAPARSSLALDIPTLAGEPAEKILAGPGIDRGVPPSPEFRGGTDEALRRFETFLSTGLDRFSEDRNDPGTGIASGMSPYLHFGQVSPVTLALRAQEHGGPGVPAFLEELIVRRELAVNFVTYNDRYDTYACLPAWVQRTLAAHAGDRREYRYTRKEFERAATHDPYWNAAQEEMVRTGKMQGYMRMYWGKKILEWSATPQEAYATALYLNNRYEIDGRDPNGFAGVAWCFGKHDRPWQERPVFGMVRYMNAAGLERKFAMEKYLEKMS